MGMTLSSKITEAMERGSWVRKMFEDGKKLKDEYGVENVFDFSLGNPIVDPPAAFQAALKEVVDEPVAGKHGYIPNQGLPAARAKVAEYLSGRYAAEFALERIVMTVGAGGGLNVVFKSILDPGDEVVLLTPFFMEYISYVENHLGAPVMVPLADDFSLDLGAIEQALTAKTRAILINTPNNPTGTLLSQDDLDGLGRVLRAAEEKYGTSIYLVYDDPYGQLLYDAPLPDPFKAYGRTVFASSFSKDLGIAGERLGYLALDTNVEDGDLLTATFVFANRTLGFVNAPNLMQRVIAKLDTLEVELPEYRMRRDLMVEILREAGYDFVTPQGGFFIFPKSPIPDDVAFVAQVAKEHKLLLVPGTGFARPGYFRLSYSVPVEQIERSRELFKKVLEQYRLQG
ncbi:pyridoxal phosphate-dependent aminotransferase [Tumebacillus lacus]